MFEVFNNNPEAPSVHNEAARVQRLGSYLIVGTNPERTFDEIASLAASLLGTSFAFIAVATAENHWFKARIGFDLKGIPRLNGFCDHTLAGEGVLCIPDARRDPRFAEHPFVAGELNVRFFAGVPLIDSDGFKLGTLAVLDTQPRAPVTGQQAAILQSLARITVDRLELRRLTAVLAESKAKEQTAFKLAEAAHARLREAIDVLPEGIVFMDAEDRYILWNKRYAELFPEIAPLLTPGITYEAVLRASFASSQNPEDLEESEVDEWITKRIADHRAKRGSDEQRFRDGRYIRYDQRETSDGGAICIRVDITDVKQREESLRMMFDSNPLPMLVVDLETLAFLAVNDAAADHYGFSKQQFLTMTALDIRPPEYRQESAAFIRAAEGFSAGDRDWVHCKADGSTFIASVFSRPLVYRGRKAALGAIIDSTERKRHEQHIHHLAHHDSLTGLPNRMLFHEQLDGALRRTAASGTGFALLLLDLDHFKTVNDTLGHPVGDGLIIAASERLKKCVRRNDIVARLGGDEFAIIQESATDSYNIDLLAHRLVAAMTETFEINGHRINVGASVGITRAPEDGTDSESLLKNSDLALYRAKEDGRGTFRHFEPQMQLHLLTKRALELDLRNALKNEELVLYYQPIANIRTGATLGFEALLRWQHPDRGLILPAEFVPIAEGTGLIVPIGAWVLQQACQDATAWRQPLTVAVNLSGDQFKHGSIIGTVQRALAKSGLEPSRLELEITETVVLEHANEPLIALKALRALGARIAMDDFGTGYSSLSYLQKYPFDKIKIDQSFVRGLGSAPQNVAIVRAILAIGHSLNIRVSAEGVMTDEELAILRDLGCLEGQGYHFGKPLRAAAISPDLLASGLRKIAG
ncbi:MAG: EAL domain-containing protein [Rhizobiales bacterium]|nr:EAL domain-containing protein [Hyphomicrobiales bacterium]